VQLSNVEMLQTSFEQLEEVLERHQRVLVRGPTGSGRGTLLRRLAEELDFICVDPPPIAEADSALHALVQIAARLDPSARAIAEDGAQPLAHRAEALMGRLSGTGRGLALRLPASWAASVDDSRTSSPDRQVWARQVRDILGSLSALGDTNLVLFVGGAHALPFDVSTWGRFELPPMKLAAKALEDLSGFSTYEKFAAQVAEMFTHLACVTPVQFRLSVGLAALGTFSEREAALVQRHGSSLRVLETRMVRALGTRPALAKAAFRLALARGPLTAGEVVSLTNVDQTDLPMLTHCLAYGNGAVRMHERIRSSVLQLRKRRELHAELDDLVEPAHFDLARHHERLDGTSSLLDSPSPVNWLERAHHLAHSGERGAGAWASLVLRSRELYWDRGRALSRGQHYAAAAAVYRQCLDRFGADDAYAQHYRAYNLDRAGGSFAEARASFEAAVGLEPANPWFNARLVTFLVSHAQYLAARRTWESALESIDPSGDVVATDDGWLAKNFHRWVVSAWLDAGEIQLAREAFDAIPPEVVMGDPVLERLENRLLDGEEAVELGEAVYPSRIPTEVRWLEPRRLAAEKLDGTTLRAWYPGRVVDADRDGVMIAFAIPNRDPAARRVKLREMTREEWERFAQSEPTGFIEVGTYSDQSVVILPIDDGAADWSRDTLDGEDLLRPLARWTPPENEPSSGDGSG